MYHLITKYENKTDPDDCGCVTHEMFKTSELLNEEIRKIKENFSSSYSNRTHISFLTLEDNKHAEWLEFEIPEQFGANRNKNF